MAKRWARRKSALDWSRCAPGLETAISSDSPLFYGQYQYPRGRDEGCATLSQIRPSAT